MIFSDSEREHYRRELEAASKAGDVKRVKRLIGQIRLLGDIREYKWEAPKIQKIVLSPANLKGIQEYIKQQKALNDKFDEHSALNYPDENPLRFLGGDDIVGFPFKSFRDVLRSGFRENGWTW